MTSRNRPTFVIIASDRHPLTGMLSLKFYDYAEQRARAYLLAAPEQGMRVTESQPGHGHIEGYHLPYSLVDAPSRTAAATDGLRDYLTRLPPEAVSAARSLGYAHYPCLALMSRFEEARQLWRTCPALLWFLGERLASIPMYDQEMIRLLRMPLKGLFRELFPGVETHGLTILRRIKGMRYAFDDAQIVRQLLRSQYFLARGVHVPVFVWSRLRTVAGAICRYKFLMESGVFRNSLGNEPQAQSTDAYHSLVEYLTDTVQLGRQLKIMHPDRTVCGYTSIEKLKRIHDRWIHKMNECSAITKIGGVHEEFPPPPIPGTDTIIPICSVKELHAEGKAMHHCVFGHLPNILTGKAFVYKVLAPERATLMIAPSRYGGYRIEEISLACNVGPSQQTVRIAERWIKEINIKLNNNITLK